MKDDYLQVHWMGFALYIFSVSVMFGHMLWSQQTWCQILKWWNFWCIFVILCRYNAYAIAKIKLFIAPAWNFLCYGRGNCYSRDGLAVICNYVTNLFSLLVLWHFYTCFSCSKICQHDYRMQECRHMKHMFFHTFLLKYEINDCLL